MNWHLGFGRGKDIPVEIVIKHEELGGALEAIMTKHMTNYYNTPNSEHRQRVEVWLEEIRFHRTRTCYEFVYGVYHDIMRKRGDDYEGPV